MRKMILVLLAAGMLASVAGCQAAQSAPESTTQIESTTQTESTTQAKESVEQSKSDMAEAVDLASVHEAVKEAYGDNYIPSMAFDEQTMEEIFGVKKDMYESYIAEGPMISVQIDTFIAVKAAEGQGKVVKKALEDYRTKQLEDSVQYPMNLPKVQSSEVLEFGDYIFFVMLGTPSMEAEEKGEEAALESSKEVNQIAIDVIEGFFS